MTWSKGVFSPKLAPGQNQIFFLSIITGPRWLELLIAQTDFDSPFEFEPAKFYCIVKPVYTLRIHFYYSDYRQVIHVSCFQILCKDSNWCLAYNIYDHCVLFRVHFINEYKSVSHFQTIHTFDKNGSAADAKATRICSS
jgi:hypothetical protein